MTAKQNTSMKYSLLDFLQGNGKYFVQIFCVAFGVIAQECYQILKQDKYEFKNVIPKLVLAWFVCLLFGAVIEQNKTLNQYYPFLIMALAFVHRRAADWIMNDFFQFILKYLNNKNTKKDE
jgi:hypothetical protein